MVVFTFRLGRRGRLLEGRERRRALAGFRVGFAVEFLFKRIGDEWVGLFWRLPVGIEDHNK
jgi:hypothetical protein